MSAVPMRSLTSLGMNMVDSLDCVQSANGFKTKLQQQIFNRVRKTQKQFIRMKQERESDLKSKQFTKCVWTDKTQEGVIVYVNYESNERGPICRNVEQMLTEHGFPYQRVDVSDDLQKWCEIISNLPDTVREAGRISIPQVFFKNQLVGGSEILANPDMLDALKQAKLNEPSKKKNQQAQVSRKLEVQPKPSSPPTPIESCNEPKNRVYRMRGQRDDDPWCIPEEYMTFLVDESSDGKPVFDANSIDSIRSKASAFLKT